MSQQKQQLIPNPGGQSSISPRLNALGRVFGYTGKFANFQRLGLLPAIVSNLLIALPTLAQINPNPTSLPPCPIPQPPADSDRTLPILPNAVFGVIVGSQSPLSPLPCPIAPPPPANQPSGLVVPVVVPESPTATQPPKPVVPVGVTVAPKPVVPVGVTVAPKPAVPVGVTVAPEASLSNFSPSPRLLPLTPTARNSDAPPLPEQIEPPIGRIIAMNGLVNIKLVNQTGATVKYQVLGDTNERTLQGRSDVTLQTLKIPVNITFERPDGGLITVNIPANSQPGILQVNLVETTNMALDKKALSIEETGDIFSN